MNSSIIKANRMPAITWHKFKGNEAEIELPALAAHDAGAVAFTVPPALKFMETTINGDVALDAGTAPVKEAFDEALAAAPEGLQQWETGMGEAADAWLDAAAKRRLAVLVPEGHTEENTLVIRIQAQDGAAAVAAVDLVAQAHSRLKVALHVDYIDFDRPENNIFKVVNQYSVQGERLRRPDLLVFINGRIFGTGIL